MAFASFRAGWITVLAVLTSLLLAGFAVRWLRTVDPPSVAVTIGLFVGAGLVALPRVVRDIEKTVQQRGRDRRARRIVGDPTSSPFFLYLRPFTSTGRLRILTRLTRFVASVPDQFGNPTRQRDYSLRPWIDSDDADLEETLGRTLQRRGPLVALGKPGEHIGAARVESAESEWRRRFFELVSHAQLVFVVPSDHAGTMWELGQILGSELWLEKTVFLVPDGDIRTSGPAGSVRYWNPGSDVRQAAFEALAQLGIDPGLFDGGAFFVVNRTRSIRLIRFFGGVVGGRLRWRPQSKWKSRPGSSRLYRYRTKDFQRSLVSFLDELAELSVSCTKGGAT